MLPRRTPRDLAKLELSIAVYAVCLPPAMIALGRLEGAWAAAASQVVFPLAALSLAVLVGLEFPLAGKVLMTGGRTLSAEPADVRAVTSSAARLYTADYLGAALGALLVSTLLIPVIGVVNVCLLVAALNVASGAVILIATRN
jgi:predicted membrane-bound spermidine synthase